MYSESAVPEFNDSMNTKVIDVSSENWSNKDSCGPNLGQPGFENIDPPQWKQYDRQQSNYMKEVETCVLRIKIWTEHWSRTGPTQHINTTQGMFDCKDGDDYEDIQQSLRNWDKQYRRIWFVGNSILGQQFDVLMCLLDPQATLNRTELSRYFTYDHESDTINQSTVEELKEKAQSKLYTLDNDNSAKFLHNQSSPSSTSFERVLHGYLFHDKERTLYETAFPTIIKYATNQDAIIMNAGAHYDHTRMESMENALRFIANQSLRTDASMFFIEPTPETWKTSNGMVAPSSLWPRGYKNDNGCLALKEARINGTDHMDGVLKMPPVSELNNASMVVYNKLYPELLKTGNENGNVSHLSHMAPKASWRSDLARSVFRERRSFDGGAGAGASDCCKVKLIPIFWQFAMSNVSTDVHDGDCTHRSLSAIVNMNIQMMRHGSKY